MTTEIVCGIFSIADTSKVFGIEFLGKGTSDLSSSTSKLTFYTVVAKLQQKALMKGYDKGTISVKVGSGTKKFL